MWEPIRTTKQIIGHAYCKWKGLFFCLFISIEQSFIVDVDWMLNRIVKGDRKKLCIHLSILLSESIFHTLWATAFMNVIQVNRLIVLQELYLNVVRADHKVFCYQNWDLFVELFYQYFPVPWLPVVFHCDAAVASPFQLIKFSGLQSKRE